MDDGGEDDGEFIREDVAVGRLVLCFGRVGFEPFFRCSQ